MRVAAWVASRIPHECEFSNCVAFGYEKHGELRAGAVFNHYTGSDIQLSVAVDRAWGALPIELLRRTFAYAFRTCGCRRITVHVGERNLKSLRFARKLGFKDEGVLREGLADQDVLVLGMLRRECRFIEG